MKEFIQDDNFLYMIFRAYHYENLDPKIKKKIYRNIPKDCKIKKITSTVHFPTKYIMQNRTNLIKQAIHLAYNDLHKKIDELQITLFKVPLDYYYGEVYKKSGHQYIKLIFNYYQKIE